MARDDAWDACPGCGGRKTRDAKRCAECHRLRPLMFGGRTGDDGRRRTIDHANAVRSDWRPDHLPPACPMCHGFGYVQHGGEGKNVPHIRPQGRRWGKSIDPEQRNDGRARWHRCPACVGHPGSVCTHAAHLANRQRMGARTDEPMDVRIDR